jgi:hypothetical protein
MVDFSASHGGEYDEGCFLGCCAVQSDRSLLTFQRSLLPPLIALMMEAASISETSASFYQTTRRNDPEDSHLRTPCSPIRLHDVVLWHMDDLFS